MKLIKFLKKMCLGCDPKFLKNMKFAKKHNLNKNQIAKRAAKK